MNSKLTSGQASDCRGRELKKNKELIENVYSAIDDGKNEETRNTQRFRQEFVIVMCPKKTFYCRNRYAFLVALRFSSSIGEYVFLVLFRSKSPFSFVLVHIKKKKPRWSS